MQCPVRRPPLPLSFLPQGRAPRRCRSGMRQRLRPFRALRLFRRRHQRAHPFPLLRRRPPPRPNLPPFPT